MNVFRTKTFQKSLKKILSGGKISLREIEKTIEILVQDKNIPAKYKDHALKGEWKSYRECHIRPDTLLVYQKNKKEIVLILLNIGSHSDLFS